MRIHAVVDYSFLYYKYKFQLDSGKMRRLTQVMDWKGVQMERDVSQIYYSLREIESFRKEWETRGDTVVVTVCFDMPSKRKIENSQQASKYKSNRVSKLNEDDFDNIQFVENVLKNVGYNTFRIDGYEADDLINHVVNKFQGEFDYSVIYTPDADLLVNVGPKVGAKRYKSGKGYSGITLDNFSEYLSAELKCQMPYNGLMMFKCTVGDKSDCIDGIKRFGPAAFDKLVNFLNTTGINWTLMNNPDAVEGALRYCCSAGVLNEDQLNQALCSLQLVRPFDIPYNLQIPGGISTRESRETEYMKYNMKSLVD